MPISFLLSNRMRTICECNHLTNFAALIDPKERHDILKSLLTYVCCGLSAICLLLTLILLRGMKTEINNTINDEIIDKKNFITSNLCISLLAADLLIIFGMERIDMNPKVGNQKILFKKILIFLVVVRIILSSIALFIVGFIYLDVYRRIVFV
jgi:hypothetical protein